MTYVILNVCKIEKIRCIVLIPLSVFLSDPLLYPSLHTPLLSSCLPPLPLSLPTHTHTHCTTPLLSSCLPPLPYSSLPQGNYTDNRRMTLQANEQQRKWLRREKVHTCIQYAYLKLCRVPILHDQRFLVINKLSCPKVFSSVSS